MLAGLFARRYLFSRKSHSVINIISVVSVFAVGVPVAAMIILLSVFNGFESLVKGMYTEFDPDIMVLPSSGKVFDASDSLTGAVTGVQGVATASFIIEQNVMVAYRGGQYIATVRGVDSLYSQVVPIAGMITAGDYALRFGPVEQAVIGRGVAYNLGVGLALDDQITLYAPRRGSFNPILPVDAFRSQSLLPASIFVLDAETDNKYIIASIEAVRNLLDYQGRATGIALKLTPGANPVVVQRALAAALGDDFRPLTRYEQKASLYRIMKYEKWSIVMIIMMVLVIASFSIVGSLVMLVIDKRHDVRTLFTIGASAGFVRSIFTREGMLIAGAGAVGGMLVGVAVCLVQQYFGVVKLPSGTFMVDSYPVELHLSDMAVAGVAIAAVSWTIVRLTVMKMIPKNTIRL